MPAKARKQGVKPLLPARPSRPPVTPRQAKVELLDIYFAEHGFLGEGGNPRNAARVYFTALNSARLAATRLSERLQARDGDPRVLARAASHPRLSNEEEGSARAAIRSTSKGEAGHADS
jgi:hypothetical protein